MSGGLSVDTTEIKDLARRLEQLVSNGGDVEDELESMTYALSGEATISADDDGGLVIDMRKVLLMTAGNGPTAYLTFDWQGRGVYETNETGTETTHYLGDEFGGIADYLADKLGGWDQ